eukprot:s2289_g1.t1
MTGVHTSRIRALAARTRDAYSRRSSVNHSSRGVKSLMECWDWKRLNSSHCPHRTCPLGKTMNRHIEAAKRLRAAAKERQQSPDGFVKELQNAMAELQVPLADRSFRKNFSRNYKVLFQANPNGYRVEVLESVLDLNATVYVNSAWDVVWISMESGRLPSGN